MVHFLLFTGENSRFVIPQTLNSGPRTVVYAPARMSASKAVVKVSVDPKKGMVDRGGEKQGLVLGLKTVAAVFYYALWGMAGSVTVGLLGTWMSCSEQTNFKAAKGGQLLAHDLYTLS